MPVSNANRVRIIGGAHRGRVLRFPAEDGLRPTPDRVRETLFNWLGQRLDALAVLDLYAGSGALALEALSRGAALAVAVERSAKLARAIEDNGRTIGAAGLEVHRGDAEAWLASERRRFDVVFADPPFSDDPWARLFPLIAPRLSDDGVVYAEAGRALSPPAGWTTLRHDRAGQVHYHLLRFER